MEIWRLYCLTFMLLAHLFNGIKAYEYFQDFDLMGNLTVSPSSSPDILSINSLTLNLPTVVYCQLSTGLNHQLNGSKLEYFETWLVEKDSSPFQIARSDVFETNWIQFYPRSSEWSLRFDLKTDNNAKGLEWLSSASLTCAKFENVCPANDCHFDLGQGYVCSGNWEKTFNCTDGQCITLDMVCNSQYECRDKSDEANCPDLMHCTFEENTCGLKDYQIEIQDPCPWGICFKNKNFQRAQAQPSLITGPTFDHTLGAQGHMMLLSRDTNEPTVYGALITENAYKGSCNLFFNYFANTKNFKMLVRFKDQATSQISTLWDVDNYNSADPKFFDRHQNMELPGTGNLILIVILKEQPDFKYPTYFALDDILMGKGCSIA